MRGRRYIHDGSVIGDPSWISKPWHGYVVWKRAASILIPLAVLFVTNPVNQRKWRAYWTTPVKKSSWIAPRVTNYGVFSLEERIEGVVVAGLQQQALCAFKSPRIGRFCETLADNMCHQKPLLWDPGDMAYTTHRLLCCILILSSLYGFICPTAPPRRLFSNGVIDGLLASVFYSPHILQDLIFETFCVYPALVEMSLVIPKLKSGSVFHTGDETLNYFFASFVLVNVVGGGSNMLASRIDSQRSYVTGFSPVIGAALAYYKRINISRRNATLMTIFGCELTANRLYWSSIGWIVLSFPDAWFPRLVAWLTAGLGGSLLAKYHLENMAVWGDLLKVFGLT